MFKLYAFHILRTLIVACLPLLLLAGNSPTGKPFVLPKTAEYQPGHLIIKLKAGFNPSALTTIVASLQGYQTARIFPNHTAPDPESEARGFVDLTRIYEIQFAAPFNMEAAVRMVSQNKAVEYAAPRYLHRTTYLTNDPKRSNQTHLVRVSAAQAFDIFKGDTNTVIGIVDSGVDWSHPDMVANIAYNRADPIDGIDNDNDGYVDNYRGWDLIGTDFNSPKGDNDPIMTASNNEHGSHVSGIAGATTDNKIGVVGTGFKCRILPIKCAADNDTRAGGNGYILNGDGGIIYGADHGCSVINCSWGGAYSPSAYEQDIINYATINKNVLIVCAAGNSSSGDNFYPACYDGILSVAATGSANDKLASFSNYNSRVSVSAPGLNIYSTIFKDTYGTLSGTSMASPLVAGAAALLRAYDTTLTPAQTIARIRATSDDIYSISPNSNAIYAGKLGKGRLNMFKMLSYTGPGIKVKNFQLTDGNDNNFQSGDTIRLKASYVNSLGASSAALTATFGSPSNYLNVLPQSSSVTLGVINTGDSLALTSTSEILIEVLPGAPNDIATSIRVAFTDGAYSDFSLIDLSLNNSYINFAYNNIGSTVASEGRLGYAGTSQVNGQGVRLKGWGNLVYEIGSIAAYSSGGVITRASSVRGNATNAYNDDFNPLAVVKVSPGPQVAAHAYNGTFASPTLGVNYDHRTYVWEAAPDTGFYIFEYDLSNIGTKAIQGLYTGFYMDADVSASGAKDVTFWDSTAKMAVVGAQDSSLSDTGGPYIGIALLSGNAQRAYRGIVNDGSSGTINAYDGFSDAELYLSLSSGVINQPMPPTGKKDVSLGAGYGPLSLQPNDSKTLAYAICVGFTKEDLRKAAQRADTLYKKIVTTVKPSFGQAAIHLSPNPAGNTLWVTAPSTAVLSIIDTKGTQHAIQANYDGQAYEIRVSTLPPGLYLLRCQTAAGTQVKRFVKN